MYAIRSYYVNSLSEVSKINIEFQDIQSGAKGYYIPNKNRIVIKSDMSDLQTIKTAIHETAHSMLHDPDKDIKTNSSKRDEQELQAESVRNNFV